MAQEHVNWDAIDATWIGARDALVDAWAPIQEELIRDAEAAVVAADGDLAVLGRLSIAPRGSEVIGEAMIEIAKYGVETVVQEAAAQGVTLTVPPQPGTAAGQASHRSAASIVAMGAWLRSQISERARWVAKMLADSVSVAASVHAISRTPTTEGVITAAEVAQEVGEELRSSGLYRQTEATIRGELGGALTQALNSGRRAAMQGAPEGSRVEASALLDAGTCTVCQQFDGHEFASLAEAERQFPVGGNKGCEGGIRCRCTLVLILDEAVPTVAMERGRGSGRLPWRRGGARQVREGASS